MTGLTEECEQTVRDPRRGHPRIGDHERPLGSQFVQDRRDVRQPAAAEEQGRRDAKLHFFSWLFLRNRSQSSDL
jgi:hypothetical protein